MTRKNKLSPYNEFADSQPIIKVEPTKAESVETINVEPTKAESVETIEIKSSLSIFGRIRKYLFG